MYNALGKPTAANEPNEGKDMNELKDQTEAACGGSALTEVLGQMLAALEIAQQFCGNYTAEDCPDTVAIPINSAIAAGRKVLGKCYYAPDGTLLNADGTRSIFDDVDA